MTTTPGEPDAPQDPQAPLADSQAAAAPDAGQRVDDDYQDQDAEPTSTAPAENNPTVP